MNNETIAEKNDSVGLRRLTGNGLKMLGVVMMVMDHLHQMFFAFGVPDWFTWIGRLVAPIFLFMCAEGFHHTRSKGRYMLLLFAGFEFVNVASHVLTVAMPNKDIVLMNNIFGTLLLCTIYMWGTDALRAGIREKNGKRAALGVLVMLLPLAVGASLFVLFATPSFIESSFARYFVFAVQLIPNLATVEGGFPMVLLGLLFYLFREKRLLQIAALAAVGIFSLLTAGGVQWLMLFAGALLLLYNGERGKGSKYFFYVFYPAHIYVFYIIATLLS